MVLQNVLLAIKYLTTIIAMLLMSPFAFGEPKDLVTLEYFAALPKFSTPKLSPNIKRIASTITYQGKPLLVVQPINPEDDKIQEKMTPINAGERKHVVENRIGAQRWIADTQRCGASESQNRYRAPSGCDYLLS